MFMGIPVGDLTAPALVGIAVMMVFFGLLVPRWTYKEKAKESERWRLAFETERERANTADAQAAKVLEGQQTSHKLIEAIFEITSKARREAGDQGNVVSQREGA